MNNFEFEVMDQGSDGIDLNLVIDGINLISLCVSKDDLENLRTEINDTLKELETTN